MIYDAYGKRVELPENTPPFVPTRQLKRAYLRQCAIATINQKAGGEPRHLRRDMALKLAKRPAFIEQVRTASRAW